MVVWCIPMRPTPAPPPLARASRGADVIKLEWPKDGCVVIAAQVQRVDEVLADSQIVERGMVLEQERPVPGRVKLPNLPFCFLVADGALYSESRS